MADIAGILDTAYGYTAETTNRLIPPEVATQTRGTPTVTLGVTPTILLGILAAPMVFGTASTPGLPVVGTTNYGGDLTQTFGDDWFEKFHVIPRSITLGNILTNISTTIDVFNAYRHASHVLVTFVNNAGAGTSITNLPSLPYIFPPLTGLLLNLLVTPIGDPQINTTLDFVFDTETDQLPITGTRIVMFPYEPEAPVTEHLEFSTTIFPHKDGSEQRQANRLCPRQSFELLLRRDDDGIRRSRLDNLMFDWQGRVFGLPVWIEPSFLTAAATAGQSSINVDDTTLADYRVGGIAIVYQDEDVFDALVIGSISSNIINFTTPIANSYVVGTRVMPIRTAQMKEPMRETRYPTNLADYSLRMYVLENTLSLADTTGWNVYAGKVLLDDGNIIGDSLAGVIDRNVQVFDGETGKFSVASTWDRSRRSSAKGFFCRTRATLWSIRKLLHAFRGRQVSFYVPTFSKEMTLGATYSSGSSTLTIVNVGYSKYVRFRQPKGDIRIVLNNGVTFARSITAASDGTPNESLSLSSPIGQNILASDVRRIEFLEKVRMDTDDVVIVHNSANGDAEIGFPIKVVLD